MKTRIFQLLNLVVHHLFPTKYPRHKEDIIITHTQKEMEK